LRQRGAFRGRVSRVSNIGYLTISARSRGLKIQRYGHRKGAITAMRLGVHPVIQITRSQMQRLPGEQRRMGAQIDRLQPLTTGTGEPGQQGRAQRAMQHNPRVSLNVTGIIDIIVDAACVKD